MKDIAPDLLKAIQDDFNERVKTNAKVRNALKAMKSKKATFKDANSFAEAIGDILAESFKKNIRPELLPDERMYYNIAERVVGESLKNNYNLVSEYSADVQTLLNKKSNLGLKGIKPQYNADKAKGIINRISSEEKYEDISWILEEPVTNFTQSIVDDTIKTNAEFQYKAGLKAKIIRKSTGHCCDWCEEVAGEYEYPDVPKDVYRRHRFCRCTVEYDPGNGRRQNVHTKKWINSKESLQKFRDNQINNIIESRKIKDVKESKRIKRILSDQLLGKEINGVEIKEITEHISERMVERNIKLFDFVDGFNNPLDVGKVKLDTKGRPSFKVISAKVTFYINPEKGSVTTIHKTGSSKIKKIKDKK